MVAQNVAFWILAISMAGAAIGVVRSQNVVHAALYLVVVLAGAAAQYILLAAEFVAWVQVLIYIGAIVILFLFGIMLTRAPMRSEGSIARCHPQVGAELKQLLVLFESGLFGLVTTGRPTPFTRLDPEAQDARLDTWRRSRVSRLGRPGRTTHAATSARAHGAANFRMGGGRARGPRRLRGSSSATRRRRNRTRG